MGIARRIAELHQAKVNALLDRAEDPREMLVYSYEQQQDFLCRMRSAVAEFEAFRYRKEALKAASTVAEAAVAWARADSFPDVAELVQAARRAEDQTAALQARAEALSEQIKAGRPVMLPFLDVYRIAEQ